KILHRVDGDHQTMLFSATLDRGIDRLGARYPHDPLSPEGESREETVAEMHHRFFLVHQMDKVKVAAAISRGVDRTLVFCRTKRGADKVVEQLMRERGEDGAILCDV